MAPPFARTCQATHLLSRVLTHTEEKPADYTSYYQEALQLHNVLAAFSAVLAGELRDSADVQILPLLPSIGLCYSAQLSLYDNHSCAEVDHPQATGITVQLEMEAIAQAGLKTTCTGIAEFAAKINSIFTSGLASSLSPLLTNSLYQAAKQLSWYIRECPRQDAWDMLQIITETLQNIGKHWAVAGE